VAPAVGLQAVPDAYQTTNVGTLAVRRRDGLLANDSGGPLQLISHTDPAHGSLTLKPDGAFEYVPTAVFVAWRHVRVRRGRPGPSASKPTWTR
jgi:hypothetical protein